MGYVKLSYALKLPRKRTHAYSSCLKPSSQQRRKLLGQPPVDGMAQATAERSRAAEQSRHCYKPRISVGFHHVCSSGWPN